MNRTLCSRYSRLRTNSIGVLTLCLVLMQLSGCASQNAHRNGINAMEKKDYARAIPKLEQAAELSPTDIEYRKDWLQNREIATNKLLAKAERALSEGRNDEAEQHYRTILKFERENQRALSGIETIAKINRAAEDAAEARRALQQGDTAEALRWAERALLAAPRQAEALSVKREIEALQSRDLVAAPTLSGLYKKPINVEFRDATLKTVFEALSRTTNINFVFDRDVKTDQRTTVFLKQTSLEDSIDIILATSQLEKKVLNSSSVLIYPNTPAKVKEYQDLVVKAFYLANVEAKQAATMLKTVLKIKDVFVDDRYNMMILRETPDTITLAERLIALQDMNTPEVMLDVSVLEVNRSNILNLGIQYPNQFTISPLGGISSGNSSGSSGSTGGATANTASVMSINDLNQLNRKVLGITVPSATINLQRTVGDGNLLANPSLRVRDREKAKVMIGDKIPVVTTTSTPNGFVAENIQYLDVGLKLEVEPTIRLRDEIGLTIGLEVSSLVSSVKTNNGSQAYQIGTRSYNSVLNLRDGETQILAGLISDEDRSSANRIPLLGDLPVLGRLFSSQNDNRQKTEIIMSITPHVIRNIQRKDPAAESFWSGTEASLKTKPLILRNAADPSSNVANGQGGGMPSSVLSAGNANTPNTGTPQAPAVAAENANMSFKWIGPATAKIGVPVTLELRIKSVDELRAAPLQIGFNPAEFEVMDVKEGDFFSTEGKSAFGHVVDVPSGRISVGASAGDNPSKNGEGLILTLQLKPRVVKPAVEIQLINATPIGQAKPVETPVLPVSHVMQITP